MSGQKKRRRTSNSSYVAINADEDQEYAFNKPSTPKRASYLSPTKASLARTNPQLLQNSARAKASRESEPSRRQSLRDAVLGNRSLHSREDPTESPHSVDTPDSAVENIPPALPKPATQRLTTPDLSSRVVQSGQSQNGNRASKSSSTTRSRNGSTPRRNHHQSFMSPPMIPMLVKSPRRTQTRSPSPEVELPPTPVQLGKGQSERPRGLHSSSPGGSAGRRVRMRGGNVYTSPLKPIAMPPLLSENEPQSDAVIASGLGEEDQEGSMIADNEKNGREQTAPAAQMDEGEQAEDAEPVGDGSRIEERKAQLDALQSELSALKEGLEELQTFRSTLGRSRTAKPEALEPGFDMILKGIDLNAPVSALPTDDNILFRKHPIPYISLFSPSTLAMSYQFWDQVISGHTTFVYQTTVVASPPWPGDALSLTFDIASNPSTEMVESVKVVSDNKRQPELSKWIQRRLEAPLHKNDIAAIVSGISSFFTATTERARIWYSLIEPSAASTAKEVTGNGDLTDGHVLTKEEVACLLPYINTKQHAFTAAGSDQRVRRSLGGTKQLMLTYEINLDWLGRVVVQTDIVTTGLNTVTAEAASKLFQEVKNVAGVSEALKRVKEILEMDGKASEKVKTNMKTKKGKARRMTAFE